MNNALSKITTRAKQIRKQHPGVSWKSAIKKAGAEYRGKAKPKKRAAGTKPKKQRAQNKGSVKRGAGSTPIAQVRQQLRDQLGRALLTKELSKRKTDKRKAQKRVTELRGKLRLAQSL